MFESILEYNAEADGKDKLSDNLTAMIEEGQKTLEVDYNAAMDSIAGYTQELETLFEEYDAVLTPAAPGEAPEGLDATGDPAFWSHRPPIGLPINGARIYLVDEDGKICSRGDVGELIVGGECLARGYYNN